MPEKATELETIAENFDKKWQFPHCLGALDGKHVVLTAPPNSGSLYYNYRGTFPVVLLALADASRRFLYIDIGVYGRNSDGGIFSNSSICNAIEEKLIDMPGPKPIPGPDYLGPVPYVFVADEAFPLTNKIMRPYPGRTLPRKKQVFNYRLSRARRIVEAAFGILTKNGGF